MADKQEDGFSQSFGVAPPRGSACPTGRMSAPSICR